MKRFIPPGIVILLLAVVLTLQLGPGVAAAPGHEASFGIGERTYIADGQIKVIDVVPYIENGRAFIRYAFWPLPWASLMRALPGMKQPVR